MDEEKRENKMFRVKPSILKKWLKKCIDASEKPSDRLEHLLSEDIKRNPKS